MCGWDVQLELQELDSQILLTQGQGSAGSNYSAMIMMNQQMNTPPNSAAAFSAAAAAASSSSVTSSSSAAVVHPSPPSQQHHLFQSTDRSSGGLYHSALSSQPSSLGSSNGYGRQTSPVFSPFFIALKQC